MTEGWDVLSLFDIVRLYDTRQGGPKGSVSKYTISEAQLIGRGARYCPFVFDNEQVAEKRKYSDVVGTPEAICETLLYHCMRDSRYIDELKRALIATGLTPQDEPIEVEYKIKDSFKKTDIYKTGFIFVNERIEKSRDSVHSLPNSIRSNTISFKCESMHSSTGLFFDNSSPSLKKTIENDPIKIKDIDKSIVYKAYRKFNSTLSFEILKEKVELNFLYAV